MNHHETLVQKTSLPVVDISPLLDERSLSAQRQRVAEEIGEACKDFGFFYIQGHGVDPSLEHKLEELSRLFFSLTSAEKSQWNMSLGGRAWRGWFPIGEELTSGLPDQKEGLYFGQDLAANHPLVANQTPLHGANLYPSSQFEEVIPLWMDSMHRVGQALIKGIALSLGLEADRFDLHGLDEALQLFRIFHYPPTGPQKSQWGVGEHTDYGLLTILKQDHVGGLQVRAARSSSGEWMDVPPIDHTFVINIGDMLEKMTLGRYLSTPHRVMKSTEEARLSFPYFLDPHYLTELKALEGLSPSHKDSQERWDHIDIHHISGTYGEYVLSKIGKVFPLLFDEMVIEE